MTNPHRSAIIYKPSGEGDKEAGSERKRSEPEKNFEKSFKKHLTNSTESDIIIKSPQERDGVKERESNRSSKNFEKSLKNLLTNEAKCGGI